MILALLIIPLCLMGGAFAAALLSQCFSRSTMRPRMEGAWLGAVTNFFDTLGIGSFAPTMTWLRLRRLVPDLLIPSTMLAGHSLATILQSIVFLILLGAMVDPVLLVGCTLAMIAGGQLGVPLVHRAPVRLIRGLVAIALLLSAAFYAMANFGLMPGGGEATRLPLLLTVAAIAVHFGLGVMLNFGVGAYAPTLAMFSLLGMDPRLAFPVMTSAGAFSISAAGIRLVRKAEIDLRIVLGMSLGGVPAVLVAAFLVRDMPVATLRWLVVIVVIYAALSLLKSAFSEAAEGKRN